MATQSAVGESSQASLSRRKDSQKPIWLRLWRARTSYFLLLIFFVPFTVFQLYPIVRSAYLSMTDYTGSPTQKTNFLGLDNFKELLSVEIKTLPRLVNEDTGEFMYQCGRKKYPASEVAAIEAEGESCSVAYENPRNILSENYKEWRGVYSNDEKRIIIGAKDPRFWTALHNTVVYVLATVFIKLVIGLLLALMLQQQSTINMLLRTVFFLPSVTAGVAVTVVWGWIFKGQPYGLVNSVRLHFGASTPIPFLSDADWTMPILVGLAIWGGIGYNMIMYLAGLQAVPAELYEAATVDGANTRQKFFYITLPLLRPTTVFLVITGIIGSFQVFDSIYILYAAAGEGMGGTLDSALTIVGYLYERGFRLFQLGYASAIAWVLFIIIFILTLINLRVGRANEAH